MPLPATIYNQLDTIRGLIDAAKTIVIMQADNPDADSLGSSLALEAFLGAQGKQTHLYCGVSVPTYLHYLSGWSRVSNELPKQFDLSIIVDASTITLFDKLSKSGEQGWVAARPCIVIDHHTTVLHEIPFATVVLSDTAASSASEVVYHVADQMAWPLTNEAGACIMTGILADTQGLSNDLATARTYRVMAELTEFGVNRPQLEEQRREYNRMPLTIFRYKAKLIERTEFVAAGRIAQLTIPQAELHTYSPLYNPIPLVQSDTLGVSGVQLTVIFKQYDDGHLTGAIRANYGHAVADKLAEHMGGGGNPYAAGFRVEKGRTFAEIKADCLGYAAQLLDNNAKEETDASLQHPDTPR